MFRISKPRLRFSLRTLLILVTLIGIYLAVLTHRAVRQRNAVEFIRQYDKSAIFYDSPPANSRVPGWLRRALGDDYFLNLTAVHLHDRFTSEALPEAIERLSRVPTLQSFQLWDANVTDDDFRHLTKLKQISNLWIYFPFKQITGEGLRHITAMDNIEQLNLIGNQITSASLRHLSQFRSLKTLTIKVGRTDDEGLQSLANCKNLESLILRECYCNSTDLKAIVQIPHLKQLGFLNMAIEPGGRNVNSLAEFEQLIENNQVRIEQSDMVTMSASSSLAQRLDEWFKAKRPELSVSWSFFW